MAYGFCSYCGYCFRFMGANLCSEKFGGTKKAVNGSIIGLIIGIFFLPPFGIIIGPFLGAFIGARMEENSDGNKAIKIALGALAGFFAGTMLKLSVSVYISYIVFQAIPSLC